MAGRFITVEGIEGAGKSTLIAWLRAYLTAQQLSVEVTREPGGTEVSEAIRQVLLQHYAQPMVAETELLLMFASRLQNLTQVIQPALARGQWVISDRFVDASFAYQGGGRGISVTRIQALATWALSDFLPDLTILLDLPASVGFSRIEARGKRDRIELEELDFFARVREVYQRRAEQDPARFCVIDANTSTEQVQAQVITALQPWLAEVV